jgi:hypothetical protein
MRSLKELDLVMEGQGTCRLKIPLTCLASISVTNRTNFDYASGDWTSNLCHVEHKLRCEQQTLDRLLELPRLRSLVLHGLYNVALPSASLPSATSRCPLESLTLVNCEYVDLRHLDTLTALRSLELRNDWCWEAASVVPSSVPWTARAQITSLSVLGYRLLYLDGRELKFRGYTNLRTLNLQSRVRSETASDVTVCALATSEMQLLHTVKLVCVGDSGRVVDFSPHLLLLDISFLDLQSAGQPPHPLQELVLRDMPQKSSLVSRTLAELRRFPNLKRLTLTCSTDGCIPGLVDIHAIFGFTQARELRLAGLRPTSKPPVDTLWLEREGHGLLNPRLQAELKTIKNLYVVTRLEI